MMDPQILALIVPGAAGFGAVLAGLGVRLWGPRTVAALTIASMTVACAASLALGWQYLQEPAAFTLSLYRWGPENYGMTISFLIDSLSVVMMAVVTTISLLVHIYSIGYMRGDSGYVRFFAYLSLFTIAMLLLVMADNFLLLFIGWEGVGLVSYLLIGFWHTRARAPSAGLKAFLVNRLGDFGFVLGMGALLAAVGSLNYAEVFAETEALALQASPFSGVSMLSLICLLFFFGAMGKSAQVPLHVWLPDSMEGPTPISAMIHAATMVTAGIFMVARLSPLFEGSEIALNLILIIGGVTAVLMGLIGLVAHDIKQVIAYSTLSQLGYMTMALGASAYAASIFHLFTHAFFKALLFLAAGSVILAMRHEQDIRSMGGLWRRMPVTAITFAVGALALVGMPGFAGFFSKETIIGALGQSSLQMAPVAHALALAGVTITTLYTMRLWYYVFQGAPRTPAAEAARDSGRAVLLPLIALMLLTLAAGFAVEEFLYKGRFADALAVAPAHDTLGILAQQWRGIESAILHGFTMPVAWPLLLGLTLGAVFLYGRGAKVDRDKRMLWPRAILANKYGFDVFYENWTVRAARAVADVCATLGDRRLLDGAVNETAHLTRQAAGALRRLQSGLVSHYALGMLLGLVAALGYLLARG